MILQLIEYNESLFTMPVRKQVRKREQNTLSHFASIDDRLLDAGCCNGFLSVQQSRSTGVTLKCTLHQLAEFYTQYY